MQIARSRIDGGLLVVAFVVTVSVAIIVGVATNIGVAITMVGVIFTLSIDPVLIKVI